MIWLALFLWSETRSESFFLLVDGRVLEKDGFFSNFGLILCYNE